MDKKKTEETAAQKQRRRTDSVVKKLGKIEKRMISDHVIATVAPHSVNYADAGSTAHVEELLDEIIEFLGIK